MPVSRTVTSTLDRMMTLNRAIDQAFASGWTTNGSRTWAPTLDIVEKNDAYEVHAELPGIDPAGVEITFEQNVLTIKGTKQSLRETEPDAELRIYVTERTTGDFQRSIRLPEYVDGDQISARFTNGLLTVTVPKAKAAKSRRIEITTK